MPIYTRGGDDGTTALYGGKRVSKDDSQVAAYGAVDELSSTLGMLMAYISSSNEFSFIEDIQHDLYLFMGYLAGAPINIDTQEEKIALFERKIDALTQELPQLTDFILPNGSISSCWAHIARVNCRKTERSLVYFFKEHVLLDKEESQIILKYINRLSDLLFTYARMFNREKEAISKKK
ncbi:MAG: cob(I)yrinic acid a,c-diamide adenosyltransferase [Candidatus Roizmanbacteria bacterium]|nr:cob(I)yrinic acid a,c-diamide adenosyltransferase [Candidatus Roizmanbacteria bacterium]